MGSNTSKEAVVPVPAVASSAQDASMAAWSTAVHAAQAEAAEIEQKLYREGYKRGRTEALASVETEIARQAAVEYAQLALNEETQRVADVAEHVKALRAKQFRAPARETQCRVEEDAVVQCDFSRTPEACAQVVRAYERCADAAIFALMNPSKAAGSGNLQ